MDALYFRVSSERQTTENQFAEVIEVAEHDDSGRDWTQIRSLLARAIYEEEVTSRRGLKRMVYRLDESVAEKLLPFCIYVEQGRSGKIGARLRPLFERMKRDAALKKFDRVLVWKVTRLGRDMREVLSTVYELADIGVMVLPVKSQTGPITSTMGKLLWAIQAWYAEMGERRALGIHQAEWSYTRARIITEVRANEARRQGRVPAGCGAAQLSQGNGDHHETRR